MKFIRLMAPVSIMLCLASCQVLSGVLGLARSVVGPFTSMVQHNDETMPPPPTSLNPVKPATPDSRSLPQQPR